MTTKNRAELTPEEWLDDIEGEFILNQEVTHPILIFMRCTDGQEHDWNLSMTYWRV